MANHHSVGTIIYTVILYPDVALWFFMSNYMPSRIHLNPAINPVSTCRLFGYLNPSRESDIGNINTHRTANLSAELTTWTPFPPNHPGKLPLVSWPSKVYHH